MNVEQRYIYILPHPKLRKSNSDLPEGEVKRLTNHRKQLELFRLKEQL
jgi:hypothetical protein